MNFVRLFVSSLGVVAVLQGCDCGNSISGGGGPPAPTVTSSPSQCGSTFVLEGGKASSTSIQIDGVEASPFDELITWSAVVTVQNGVSQTFQITAVDATGAASAPTAFTATVGGTTPAPPTVDAITSPTATSPIDVSGTKPAGTAVWMNGLELVPASADTTFSVQVSLGFGSNQLDFVSSDGCGDSSVVSATVVYTGVVNLTDDKPTSAPGRRPAVTAVDSGSTRFAVAWHEDTNNDDIYMRLVLANGLGPRTRVSSSDSTVDGDSQNVAMVADAAGVIHLVWQDRGSFDGDVSTDFDIVYRSFDGASFSDIVLLSDGSTDQTANSQNPAIAVDPSDGLTVHVVWQQEQLAGDTDIWHRQLDGTTWSAIETVHANDEVDNLPKVAVDPDGQPHVVWMCDLNLDLDGVDDIDVCHSIRESGIGFSPTPALIDDSGTATDSAPVIAVDAGAVLNTVHMAWLQSGSAGVANVLSRYDDGGLGPKVTVSDGASDTFALQPAIAVDADGNVAYAWPTKGSTAADTDFDVVVRRATPTLGAYEPLSDPGNTIDKRASLPALVYNATGELLVVWQDNSTDHDDIFGKVLQ